MQFLAKARARATAVRPGTAHVDVASGLPRTPYRSLAARLQGLPGSVVLDRLERIRFRRRLSFRLGGASHRIVERRGTELQVTEIQRGASGRSVARANLDLVLDTCDRTGIPYFQVPEPNALRFRIGIEEQHWSALVDAIRGVGRTEPVYVRVGAQTRRGEPRRWAGLTIDPRIGDAMRAQAHLEIFRMIAPDRGVRPLGHEAACVVDRWSTDEDNRLRALERNDRAEFVARSLVGTTMTAVAGRRLPTLDLFAKRHVFDVDFPIDVVYLWVDGDDPAWRARKAAALGAVGVTPSEPDATADARFRDGGELRYSMRSVHHFAPWVRRVYLVTDRQVPTWLDLDEPRITLVDHRDLFGPSGTLPTFNSHAIGARLHHIDDLAEHYLYFNDDVFMGRDASPSLFFDANGISRFFLSRTSLGFSDDAIRLSHESARRNVANLIENDFGRTPTNVFYHSPIPQRRSTMFELERRYPNEFKTTWNNQFRSHTDIEPNSWLHNYFGYLTGRAMPGRIRYSYVRIGDPDGERELGRLAAARDRDVFCINDHLDATAEQHAFAADWLARYFPEPSPFEKTSRGSR